MDPQTRNTARGYLTTMRDQAHQAIRRMDFADQLDERDGGAEAAIPGVCEEGAGFASDAIDAALALSALIASQT